MTEENSKLLMSKKKKNIIKIFLSCLYKFTLAFLLQMMTNFVKKFFEEIIKFSTKKLVIILQKKKNIPCIKIIKDTYYTFCKILLSFFLLFF